MRVMALVETAGHVCYRYRIEAFAADLAACGMTLEAVPLARSGWRRLAQLRQAGRADVVILQRRLLSVLELLLLRRHARALVFDFDDAVFQRDSYSPKGAASSRRMFRFWTMLCAADAVIAGNDYLRSRAAALVESDRVTAIPTCVDLRRYQPARHQRRGAEVRLVWIGQRSTLASLGLIRPHLAAAARRLPGLTLRVICDAVPELEGVRIEPRRWSSATEADDLADADIGITWLPDDAWSRGKCGLRALQFMAAGLPVVANPVGMNSEMVVPERTGILATTPDQWAAAVARLADDPPLRQSLGNQCRQRVAEQYDVACWGPRFADLIEQVGSRRRIDTGAPDRSPASPQAHGTTSPPCPRNAAACQGDAS